MELYQIRYFLKVAETEHMTRAARELNLSEPTLSRTIRQLEEELETKLFERRGRSIVLTESGSILMSRASEVLKQMEGLQAEVRGARQTRQPVRLVARAAASILPGLLESFHKTQPDIAVSVMQNDNHVIRNQEYDLMIAGTIMQPPKYSSTVLLDDPFRVLLPLGHPLCGQKEVELSQLSGEAMIGLTPNRFISTVISQVLEEQQVRVVHHVYSDDTLMIRNLVERGLGFAIVPAFTLRSVDKQRLCELPIKGEFPSLHLVLSWKPDTYHPEQVRWFRRFVLEYFHNLREKEYVPF